MLGDDGSPISAFKERIPLTAPIGTELLSVNAFADKGAGPLRFALQGSFDGFSVTPQGTLLLVEAPPSAGTVQTSIVVTDNRTSCTQPGDDQTVVTTVGPCTTSVRVFVEIVVFLGCRPLVTAYVPLDTAFADVQWDQPRLPDTLKHLAVSVDLADTKSRAPPFTYSVGRRTVRYESEPLRVGGGVVCEFDVVVRTGFAVDVTSIARTATTLAVQEFLLVEVTESDDGARLPSFEGPLGGKTLSVGVSSPRKTPFSVSPVVSVSYANESNGKDAAALLPYTCRERRKRKQSRVSVRA